MGAACWCAVASVVGALVVTSPLIEPAYAQDKAELDKARNQFREAIAAETAGNWAGALKLLREVANVKMTPQVRYNIALCEENLGQLVNALGDYELALVDARAANASDVVNIVAPRVEALRSRVPKVVLTRAESARLATITLDGVTIGAAMLNKEMPVDPGAHVVEAAARGYKPFRQQFDTAERDTKTIQIELEAEAAAPAPAESVAAPPATAAADTGERKPDLVPFIVGGAGIASLAASGVFYALRSGTMNDLDAVCGPSRDDCPESSESTFNRGRTYTTLANVTLGLGVAALGTGAVLYFTGQQSRETAREPGVGVAPAAPSAQLGASVVGRF